MIDTLTAHWVGTEVRYKLVDAPLPVNQLWRVKHDTYPFTRLNLPEVHPLLLNHFSEFGRSWQLLERALNSHLTDAKWRALHGYKRAFNNGNKSIYGTHGTTSIGGKNAFIASRTRQLLLTPEVLL